MLRAFTWAEIRYFAPDRDPDPEGGGAGKRGGRDRITLYIYQPIYTLLGAASKAPWHERWQVWACKAKAAPLVSERDQNYLKVGSNHLFWHPKCSRITVANTRFRLVFGLFLVPNWHIFKGFRDFQWAKNWSPMPQTGFKPLLVASQIIPGHFGKNPFLALFWS